MTIDCLLAINNHWLMTKVLNDIFCELPINNYCGMREPLKEIWL